MWSQIRIFWFNLSLIDEEIASFESNSAHIIFFSIAYTHSLTRKSVCTNEIHHTINNAAAAVDDDDAVPIQAETNFVFSNFKMR